jgi:hypothetical protein
MRMLLVPGQRMDIYLNPNRVTAIKKASPSRLPSKSLIIMDVGYEYYSTATREELVRAWEDCING